MAEACRRGPIPCVEHKRRMTTLLTERLEPYRHIREEMAGREDELWDILRRGSRRAAALARSTLEKVRSRMGLPWLRQNETGQPPDLTGMLCY